MIFFLVPPPRVEVSINNGRFISERIITLFCTVNLPSSANSGETVVTTWLGPSGLLGNSSTVTVSNTYAIANGDFQSSVTITSFVPSVSNGEYICNGTVLPSSSYVTGSTATARQTVMISGEAFKGFQYSRTNSVRVVG